MKKTVRASRCARKRALSFALLASPSLVLLAAPAHAHAAVAACGATYTVRPGDSLWSIGAACGVGPATLRSLNASVLGRYLLPGQTLRLTSYTAAGAYAPGPAATPGASSPGAYVVRPGDALDIVAQRLHTSAAALAAANGLTNVNRIRVGQVLRWPVARVYRSATAGAGTTTAYQPSSYTGYLVRLGDTLSGIALSRNLSLNALAAANGITNGRLLRAGSVLRLPLSTGSASSAVAQGTPPRVANAPAAVPAVAATTTILSSGAYRVKAGDTLSSIALALGLTPDRLASSNGLNLQMPIQVGQTLRYAILLYNSSSRAEIGAVLDQQSAIVGIEGALLKAVAWRESSWRMVDAADGGIGVMQLMPDTVDWLKTTYVPGAWDAHNLTDNVHAGAVLLLVYDRMYGGDIARVATAYHGGMGVVGQTPTAEMTHYIDTVTSFRQAFLSGVFPG